MYVVSRAVRQVDLSLCRGVNHKIINFEHVKGGGFLSLFINSTYSDFSIFKYFTTGKYWTRHFIKCVDFNSSLNIPCFFGTALFFLCSVHLSTPLPFWTWRVRLRAPASYWQFFSTNLNEKQTLILSFMFGFPCIIR